MEINPLADPAEIIRKASVRLFAERKGGRKRRLEDIDIGAASMRSATIEAYGFIDKHGLNVSVLVDSLELYNLSDHYEQLALAGLLRCVNTFRFSRARCSVVMAFPAEIYQNVVGFSANVLKDFQHTAVVSWSSAGLLKMASKRYAEYLRIYERDIYEHYVVDLDLEKRDDVNVFWSLALPEMIENKLTMWPRGP